MTFLGLHVTSSFSKTKEPPKLLSLSGTRGDKFISVNNFSAQEHTSSKNRHIFRDMAVRDKAMNVFLKKYILIFELN